MTEQPFFRMSFDPKTIQHLGIRMYSTLPPVITELIANSYDSDAETVYITLLDSDGKKEIIVQDDGIGMTFTELNDKFLRIGRNRRDEEGMQETPKGRKIIGKKGIGKLSFFGIARQVEINTKKNGKQNSFIMKWEDIKNSSKSEYNPEPIFKDKRYSGEERGTRVILKDMKRETDFTPKSLADGISKNFIMDSDFKIIIRHNSEEPIIVNNERKYDGINKEIEWDIPQDIDIADLEYENKDKIIGHLIATKLPISPKTNMKGITLFSRKKLVNFPEYFSDSTSSHIFSYLTGWLEVDFIDDLEEDVIATNRQSLNWNHLEMAKLREYLSKLISKIEKDWRKKRTEIREKKISEVAGIDISDWYSKMPEDIKAKVKPIVEALVKDAESSDEVSPVVKKFHDIIPEYPRYHWRQLHPLIQDVSKEDYKRKDYYRAFLEAAKKYINEVRLKSSSENRHAQSMMGEVFGKDNSNRCCLTVTKKYMRPNGENFNQITKEDIEDGQKYLSMGVVTGGRNPVTHEEIEDLRESGLFSENDCLDALSLLSHLFRRLDESELKEENA